MNRKPQSSFSVAIGIPANTAISQRELFAQLALRAASGFSFLGMEDWALDLGDRPKVLGIADEFHDLSGLVGRSRTPLKFYFGQKKDGEQFARLLRNVVSDLRVGRVTEEKPRDWMKAWRKHYKPVAIARGALWIYPAWIPVPTERKKRAVRIYPGQAFGTGTHETTQLCLEELVRVAGHGSVKTILDFGAGTGILAIAALKLIPKARAEAVEIDQVACEQLKKNARINRAKLPVKRELGALKKYDLIFANVLAPLLLSFREEILARLAGEGELILSGILAKEVDVFVKEFCAGIARERVTVRKKKAWAMVVVRGRDV